MASLSDRASEWLARLGPTHPARTGTDLSRMSLETAIARHSDSTARTLRSKGWLRLFGEGVRGHVASFSGTGEAMMLAQRAVTAIGAAMEGQKSLRGRLSQDVIARTQLGLVASPSPGSVLLKIEPEASPAEELYPRGEQPLFDDDQRTLADKSLTAFVELIVSAANLGADAEPLVQQLDELGPRVASSVDVFAECLVNNGFELELTWAMPGASAAHGVMDLPTAQRLRNVVRGRELDAEPIQLTGRLHTISDVSKWVLEASESGELISLRAHQLQPHEVSSVRIGQLVSIDALVRQRLRPGGAVTVDYTAVRLNPIDG